MALQPFYGTWLWVCDCPPAQIFTTDHTAPKPACDAYVGGVVQHGEWTAWPES